MGWFDGLANITGLQAANIYNNPEQAAVGANTPESTYALNKTAGPTMDKHYTPTISMTGGYTQGEMQQNAAQGYSNTGAAAANAVGNAVAEYMTGGAATPLIMGQAAADQYARAHPHSNFNQEYNGIIASNPNINEGLSNSGYGSGYSYAKGGDVNQPSGLHYLAKQLQNKGRGQDSVLVHMTPNEVGGLQALAKSQGGSLTRNPETGLYEAGFLSSVLPMVAGAALTVMSDGALAPWAAGLMVGAADYAMTGSLQQGLTAGLGAWSGGSLGAGISEAGVADLAQQGGDTSAKAFEASQQAALEEPLKELPVQGLPPSAPTPEGPLTELPTQGLPPSPAPASGIQDIAKNQLSGMNLTPEQQAMYNDAIARNPSQATNIMRSAGVMAAPTATTAQGFSTGITSLGDIGSAIKANPMAAVGAALPLVSGSLFKQPTVNAPANSVNTVNQPLQRLSPDYKGSVMTTPTTHYQAAYPNYVQTPYNPYTGTPAVQSPASTIYGAEGGLMQGGPVNTDFMGGDMYPQSQIQRSYYATPTQAPTSAQAAMASYEPNTNPLTGELTANMAEGGIAGLADGGKTADYIYHPSYVNYAQTPFNPATAQSYGGIPTPTRAPMGNTQTPGIAGYAIDPKGMIGSPAYQQLQDQLAAAQAAQQALGGPFNMAGGGLTAFAKGSKDAVGNKDMAAIDNYTAQAQQEGGLAAVKDAADNGDWNAMLALQKMGYKASGGGISDLGSYSDGGRLLKGPGDGVSDGIPAQIGARQPARLADGEFVVPARIVSELGNGSTDAGAKRLYAMMQRVQAKRKKSMGKGKFAVNSKAEKDLPA